MPKISLKKNGEVKKSNAVDELGNDFLVGIIASIFALSTAFFTVISKFGVAYQPSNEAEKVGILKALLDGGRSPSSKKYKELWAVYKVELNGAEDECKKYFKDGGAPDFDKFTEGDKLLWEKFMLNIPGPTETTKETTTTTTTATTTSERRNSSKRKRGDDNNNNNAPVIKRKRDDNNNNNAPGNKRKKDDSIGPDIRMVSMGHYERPRLRHAEGFKDMLNHSLSAVVKLGNQAVINFMYCMSFLMPGLGLGRVETANIDIDYANATMTNAETRESHFVDVQDELDFKQPGKLVTDFNGEFNFKTEEEFFKAIEMGTVNAPEHGVVFTLFWMYWNVITKYSVKEEDSCTLPVDVAPDSAAAAERLNFSVMNVLGRILLIPLSLSEVLSTVFTLDERVENCLEKGHSAGIKTLSEFWKHTKCGCVQGLHGGIFFSIFSLYELNMYNQFDANLRDGKKALKQLQYFFFNDLFVEFVTQLQGTVQHFFDEEGKSKGTGVVSIELVAEVFKNAYDTVTERYAELIAAEYEKTRLEEEKAKAGKKGSNSRKSRTAKRKKSEERKKRSLSLWIKRVGAFVRVNLMKLITNVTVFDAEEHPNNDSVETPVDGARRGTNKEKVWTHQNGIRRDLTDVLTGEKVMNYGLEAKRLCTGVDGDKQSCPKTSELYGSSRMNVLCGLSGLFGNTSTIGITIMFNLMTIIYGIWFTRLYPAARNFTKRKKVMNSEGILVNQDVGAYGYPKILTNAYGDGDDLLAVWDRKEQIKDPKRVVIQDVQTGKLKVVAMTQSQYFHGIVDNNDSYKEYLQIVKDKSDKALKGAALTARKKVLVQEFTVAPSKLTQMKKGANNLRDFSKKVLNKYKRPTTVTTRNGLSKEAGLLVGHSNADWDEGLTERRNNSTNLHTKKGIWFRPSSVMAFIVNCILMAVQTYELEVANLYEALVPNLERVNKYGKDHTWHLPSPQHLNTLKELLIYIFVKKGKPGCAAFSMLLLLFKNTLGYDVKEIVANLTGGSSLRKSILETRVKYINEMIKRLTELFNEAGQAHNNGNGGSRKKPRVSIQPNNIHDFLVDDIEDNNIFNKQLADTLADGNRKNWRTITLEQVPTEAELEQAEEENGPSGFTFDGMDWSDDEDED